jgi:hypothetical protein
MPEPTGAVRNSQITISGVALHLHVLDDGTCIIDAPDVARLLEAWVNGVPLTMQEAEFAAHFIKGMRWR